MVLGDWVGAGTHSQIVIDSLAQSGRGLLENAVVKVRKEDLACDSVLEQAVGGRVADHVLEQAAKWPADLIVMGTHGRRGFSRLALGSDAELVVRDAKTPVLLVRGDGWSSVECRYAACAAHPYLYRDVPAQLYVDTWQCCGCPGVPIRGSCNPRHHRSAR